MTLSSGSNIGFRVFRICRQAVLKETKLSRWRALHHYRPSPIDNSESVIVDLHSYNFAYKDNMKETDDDDDDDDG